MSPGYPIEVVAAESALARELNAFGTGKHKCHTFLAWPVEFSLPDEDLPSQHSSEVIDDDSSRRLTVRNSFDDDVSVGDEFIVMLGADGVATILVWKC